MDSTITEMGYRLRPSDEWDFRSNEMFIRKYSYRFFLGAGNLKYESVSVGQVL